MPALPASLLSDRQHRTLGGLDSLESASEEDPGAFEEGGGQEVACLPQYESLAELAAAEPVYEQPSPIPHGDADARRSLHLQCE